MREDAGIIIIIPCFLLLACLPHLFAASPSSFSCRPDQRHALLRFIHSFSITDSYCPNTYYPKVASWREGEDCCSWEGVTCDNSTGNVIGLDLTCAGLLGPINSSSPLFSLRHLRHLSLAGNLFGSTLPPEIGVFSRMTVLNLSYSSISGVLPTEISQLSKLVSLDLSDNFWLEMREHTMRKLIQNLTQMEKLNLSYVDMSTVAPTSFMNFSSSLISLKLIGCSLGGKFPGFIFGLPNLQVIDLSENYGLTGNLSEPKWSPKLDCLSLRGCSFAGAVPDSIGNLTELQELSLSFNSLSGPLPPSLANSTSLKVLDIAYNMLEGPLPVPPESIQIFQVNNNLFSGSIPPSMCRLTSMPGLDFGQNNLTGTIPQCLENLTNLQDLSLSNNLFSGWLPQSLINLTSLRRLDVGENILEGPLPIPPASIQYYIVWNNRFSGSILPFICQLNSLSDLPLSQNNLTGAIPECLGNLTILSELHLSNNSLSGHLPPSLANCSSLFDLDVSHNSIGGPLPTWLSTSSIYSIKLQSNSFIGWWPHDIFLRSEYIDLSDNRLEGPLPLPSYATAYYSVSNNHFSGNLSSFICNATALGYLDLSNNNLMGTLPHCLKNVTEDLFYLNVRENEFGGRIPEIFCKGSYMASVDLSRNQFEGSLPRSLSNCKSLGSLDVGSNKITGSFPSWLGNLPLKVLSLRSNNFYGHIIVSKKTPKFSRVRILDLSNNNFEGNITDMFIGQLLGMKRYSIHNFHDQYMAPIVSGGYYSVMINLKGVETEIVKINVRFALLDLSSNRFHGKIPNSIGLLKSLEGMNFSHNRFTETIPPSIGKLVNLESLDLSSNHLMGEIPKELVKLTFLGFLDLSRNNLTGPIPLGGHFNTFSNSSFQGNPGLCGIPLIRSCGPETKEAKPLPKREDDGEEEGGGLLVWEYVALGFGSGMGMGISLGYMVLEMGRPLWLVRMVIRLEAGCWKRGKRKGDPRRNG